MTDQPKAAEQPKVEKKELPKEQQKMQLEQDQYGMWVYWRDPWLYGQGVDRNGVIPVNTVERADAEAYVNRLYPGAFPEPEKKTEAKSETKSEVKK